MRRHLLCMAAVITGSSFFMSTQAQDQSLSSAKPKFEVASIKQCKDTDHPPPATSSPGRLSLSCSPLMRLIQDAYEGICER